MKSLSGLMDLNGRKALVTGGAGHIALAVEEALVELGAATSVLDVDKKACEERVQALSHHSNSSGFAIPCDLRDEGATRSAIRQGIDQMGGLDILVHCAAFGGTTQYPGWAVPFEEQSVDAWNAALSVNLTAAFVMVQEAKDALAASGHGSVILFASIYGIDGPDMALYEGTEMANPAGYGASKGGLIQLTRYLATILAPRIRVNAISPGGVWRDQPQAFHQRYVARTPMGRMAAEQDLKGAVAYLSSDLSEYVTGHNLVVDGGWTAW
jgi:NAD(P)-dependent dehydrogenase (short-subunit alcohol dehydrogenase family)